MQKYYDIISHKIKLRRAYMKTKLLKKIASALTLSTALLMTTFPVSSVDNTDLTIIEENNIPVVYLNIDESAEGFGTIQEMNDSFDHSVKCTGTVRIDVPDGYTGDYSDIVLEDTDELQLEYIRGRGNVTWWADKKPYKFKLDKKAELLGMGKNKHWALLANRYDASMIRNRVASYISENMGFAYTPKMLPVDLVINGKYEGSYFLSETVRIGKSRVNIDELTEDDNTEPNITGGYLMGIHTFSNKTVYDENLLKIGENISISFEEPEFYSDDGGKIGTPQQREYITDYIRKTVNAIFGDDFKDNDGVPYTDYMDIQSTADYWWIQEFSRNHDAYETTSNYLYKERDGKLYWGPLWDFDYAFGLYETETYGFNRANFLWTDHIRAYDTQYQQLLRERWKVLDSIITDVIKPDGIIDKYVAEQEKSAASDHERWGTPFLFHEECGFRGEAELLRTWMAERQAWINEHIDTDLTKVFCTVTFKFADGSTETRTTENVPILKDFPQAPTRQNDTFLGWADQTGKIYESGDIIYNDLVLTPLYSSGFQPSEASDISDVSEVSEVSEISEISQTSQISEVSEVSEISQISDISAISEISEISKNSDTPEQSTNVQNSSANTSKQISSATQTTSAPVESIPQTGDTFPTAMFFTILLSLFTAFKTGKKSKA